MNALNAAKTDDKRVARKILDPAIGEIYCLNETETRMILDEIFVHKFYLQEGISISPGDIVLDVGANIGAFTLFAARHGAHVYAYEPIPATFELLQLNIQLHGFDKIAQPRNIGLSDRAEEKVMFHHPRASVLDSWTARDAHRDLMGENWEEVLEVLKTADPDQYHAIRGLGTKTLQQNAMREQVKTFFASTVEIECEFDTLSGAIAKEDIQSIGLLKLDAELADWEILDGVKAEDWSRIQQVAMEVHKSSDVEPISKFFTERGFNHVVGKPLKLDTGYVWARK
jgi:FkbM family methyltransferase